MGGFSLLPPSGPSHRDPQALRNPFLDEIDRAATDAHAKLSPGAQEALRRAGAPLPQAQAGAPSLITSPKAAPPPMTLASDQVNMRAPMSEQPPSGTPDVISAMPSAGIHSPTGPSAQTAPPVKITPPTAMAGPAQDEYNRLTIGKQATAGVNQIKSPWARVPLQVAAGLAETFAPRFAAAIPGTESHHQLLVGQAGEAVDQQNRQREEEEKAGTAAANQHHLEAEAANQESLPELNAAKAEAAAAKQREQSTHDRATEDLTRTKNEAQQSQAQAALEQKIRASGYDPKTGEPLPYDQLSEQQQAVHDWRAAQAEERSATAALRDAQAKNQPAMLAIAQQRLKSAADTRSVAERRLNLSEAQFEMRSTGTHNGIPYEGATLSEQGKSVGTSFQQNVRPTGQERNKADLAISAHQQIQDLKGIVQRRQDIFGPAAGRKTDFTVWLGSQDPDAQAFRAARTIAGDHLAGVFGGRSEAALNALDSAIGHFKDNPKAVIAGLDQLDKANSGFIEKGTPRTVGSQAAKQPPVSNVDPKVKAFADQYFGGDVNKAQAEIDNQRKGKK